MFSFTKKNSKSSLELTYGDSRAQAYRKYLVSKMESSSENHVSIKSTWRGRSTRRLVFRVYEFRSLVKNRLVLIVQAYTHTHTHKNLVLV